MQCGSGLAGAARLAKSRLDSRARPLERGRGSHDARLSPVSTAGRQRRLTTIRQAPQESLGRAANLHQLVAAGAASIARPTDSATSMPSTPADMMPPA